MFKKIIVFIAVFGLIFLISGCSESKTAKVDGVVQAEIQEKGDELEDNMDKNEDEAEVEIQTQNKVVEDSKTNEKNVLQNESQEKRENVAEKANSNMEVKKLNPIDLERYSEEGAVQMGIIFANPLGMEKEGYLTFVVQMDNHSYNLDEYDLSQYVVLVDDQGNSPKGEIKWEIYSGGGHHVINYLLFPDNGFITPETKHIKLIFKDFIDVPQRKFVWEKEFLGVK